METTSELIPLREPYASLITHGGWWHQRLHNISNPRRLKWNSYYRACKRIPKGTKCYGVTSWKKINERRCKLIARDVPDGHKEFEALQDVAGEVANGELVASNFLSGRYLRRLQAEHPEITV